MSSPLIFESSDEESSRPLEIKSPEDDNFDKPNGLSEAASATQETSEEHKRIDRIRNLLMGVPPPPAVTVSQYNACEILQLFRDNSTAFEWLDNKVGALQVEELIESFVNGAWPNIRDQHWFNICYNRGSVSEELALLTVKYQERYISNETSSSVNSFFSKSPIRTASAKKRARRHPWGHSPGRRLSHLARRRHTFSSASLQQNATKSQPDKKKMILVERRKAQALKKGRNSATKASGSTKSVKSISTVKTKRALFQSPENEKKSGSSLLSDKSRTAPRVDSVLRSKRALWPDKPDIDKENGTRFNFNGNSKRPADLMNPVSNVKKKCLRSLSFSEEKTACANSSVTSTMPSLVPENLSQLHRKKLLWAVSNALRKEGIGMEHSLSKPCMSELFRICRELWLKKCINEERSGSTSDRMLELANKFSAEVVRKVKIRLDILKNSEKSLSASSDKKTSDNVKKFANNILLTEKLDGSAIDESVTDSSSVSNAVKCQSVCKTNSKMSVSPVNKCDSVNTSVDIKSSEILESKSSPMKHKINCAFKEMQTDSTSKVLKGDDSSSSDCKSNNLKSENNMSNSNCLLLLDESLKTNDVKNERALSSANNVNSSDNDKEATGSSCSNLYNAPFSPALSTSSVNEDTKCLSGCDIDMNRIIDSINSDDDCD